MHCPHCKKTMTSGRTYLKKSLIDFLLLGLGSTDLVFKEEGQKKSSIVFWPGKVNTAHKCSHCHTLVISGNTQDA